MYCTSCQHPIAFSVFLQFQVHTVSKTCLCDSGFQCRRRDDDGTYVVIFRACEPQQSELPWWEWFAPVSCKVMSTLLLKQSPETASSSCQNLPRSGRRCVLQAAESASGWLAHFPKMLQPCSCPVVAQRPPQTCSLSHLACCSQLIDTCFTLSPLTGEYRQASESGETLVTQVSCYGDMGGWLSRHHPWKRFLDIVMPFTSQSWSVFIRPHIESSIALRSKVRNPTV